MTPNALSARSVGLLQVFGESRKYCYVTDLI